MLSALPNRFYAPGGLPTPSKDHYTLCGISASLDIGQYHHQFTIGGVLTVNEKAFALTVLHSDPEEPDAKTQETSIESLVKEMVEKGAVAKNIKEINVASSTRRNSGSEKEMISGDPLDSQQPTGREHEHLGTLTRTGEEWALISIDDPGNRLPNCIEVPDHGARLYLDRVQDPEDVLAKAKDNNYDSEIQALGS
ncbi:hypothetical protein M0657_008808 [Pyricularia oryzae]|nr:hypothetical protein M9X92_009279 [Pyricularia oryzae]KAI7915996.1 hypothetical protein M0657_008808 [Pyricularia oryzae]